jgi:hypothetical protein
MSTLQRIENIGQLWELILPDIPKPSPSWIGRWCAYPDEDIERGIIRAAKKFGPDRINGTPDPELVYRYTAGVARNEFEARRQQYE